MNLGLKLTKDPQGQKKKCLVFSYFSYISKGGRQQTIFINTVTKKIFDKSLKIHADLNLPIYLIQGLKKLSWPKQADRKQDNFLGGAIAIYFMKYH